MIATIATIAAIAGKNVQQSLRLCGNHFLAIVTITAIIWKSAYIWKLLSDQSRHDPLTFLVAIVAIVWKPGLRGLHSPRKFLLHLLLCFS